MSAPHPAGGLCERLRAVLVTDDRGDPVRVARVARAARLPAAGSLPAVLVREKSLAARDRTAFLEALQREGLGSPPPLLLVNDPAGASLPGGGAGGVHLPSRGIPVAALRRKLGPSACIGVSTHSLDEALAAQRGGASYVFFGPIGDTPSKRGILPPRGTGALEEVARALSIPVIAIGGADRDCAPELSAAGAAGAAAIRAFFEVPDPAATTAAFLGAFRRGTHARPGFTPSTRRKDARGG